MIVKKCTLAILILVLAPMLWANTDSSEENVAEEEIWSHLWGYPVSLQDNWELKAAYYFPRAKDWQVPEVDQLQRLHSSWGGAEIGARFQRRFSLPFLVGEKALFKKNRLDFIVGADFSPVHFEGSFDVEWSPIAFFVLSAGSNLGSGWNFLGLFNGLGMQKSDGTYFQNAFDGLVSQSFVGGTFQFDLAAFIPGDWNHVILVQRRQLFYQNYSSAQDSQAWQYKNDAGENFDSFKWKADYILAYQMPIPLSMVGLVLSTQEYLGSVSRMSPMASGGWGSDFIHLTSSLFTSYDFSQKLKLFVSLDLNWDPQYTTATKGYQNFMLRKTTGRGEWAFNRIGFSLNYQP